MLLGATLGGGTVDSKRLAATRLVLGIEPLWSRCGA